MKFCNYTILSNSNPRQYSVQVTIKSEFFPGPLSSRRLFNWVLESTSLASAISFVEEIISGYTVEEIAKECGWSQEQTDYVNDTFEKTFGSEFTDFEWIGTDAASYAFRYKVSLDR